MPEDKLEFVPSSDRDSEGRLLGWASEAISEGEAFLKAQTGYGKIGDCIDAVMGETKDIVPSTLSEITLNRMGKIGLDFASLLTDIKPFWEYRTWNKHYDQQAEMSNKLGQGWWTNRNIDLRFADVIKYAECAGTGYAHMLYNSGWNDLDMIAEDPRDVIPIRPASNFSVQDCFGVVVRRERTVNYVREMGRMGIWRNTQYVVPDREGSVAALQRNTRAAKLMSAMGLSSGFLSNLFASLKGGTQAHMNIPTVDVFTLYVKDYARNGLSTPVLMGEPDKNWSYTVEPGGMLYPRGRTIIFTHTAVLYDGPNTFWHGKFPLVKVTLDQWPWSWLGKPPLMDLLPLQRELDRLMKIVGDHNQKVGRPGVVGDKNAVSRTVMNELDTRRSGMKLRVNPVQGKPVEIVHEPPLDPGVQMTINFLIEQMDKLSGVQDLTNLAQLGQIPSTETIEKLVESMSPSVRMRSRMLEASMREMAHMTLSNFFQFYTTAQRVAVLGPSGLTFEDFDFDPGTLIPDFLEGDLDEYGKPKAESVSRGPRPRADRAQEFLRYFTFHIAPGSLLSASEVTNKLLYMQLAKAGVIDWWTLLDKLGIPNVGNPPEGATTIMERLKAMQDMGLNMAANSAGRKQSNQTGPRAVTKTS